MRQLLNGFRPRYMHHWTLLALIIFQIVIGAVVGLRKGDLPFGYMNAALIGIGWYITEVPHQ